MSRKRWPTTAPLLVAILITILVCAEVVATVRSDGVGPFDPGRRHGHGRTVAVAVLAPVPPRALRGEAVIQRPRSW